MTSEKFLYEIDLLNKLRQRYKSTKDPEEKARLANVGKQKKTELMLKFDIMVKSLLDKYKDDSFLICVIKNLYIW